jgi:hypothetical protein
VNRQAILDMAIEGSLISRREKLPQTELSRKFSTSKMKIRELLAQGAEFVAREIAAHEAAEQEELKRQEAETAHLIELFTTAVIYELTKRLSTGRILEGCWFAIDKIVANEIVLSNNQTSPTFARDMIIWDGIGEALTTMKCEDGYS